MSAIIRDMLYETKLSNFAAIRNSVAAEKDRAVPVTEEAESIRQCIIVNPSPIASNEGGYQKDSGTLRLMEISDKHINQPEVESRDDDDSGANLDLSEALLL